MTHPLTAYREDKKLTLEAFGLTVQASKSQVWKWENGSIPRPKQMARIIEATNGAVSAQDWYIGEVAA